jgi:hypothetical protein
MQEICADLYNQQQYVCHSELKFLINGIRIDKTLLYLIFFTVPKPLYNCTLKKPMHTLEEVSEYLVIIDKIAAPRARKLPNTAGVFYTPLILLSLFLTLVSQILSGLDTFFACP